MTGDNPFSYPYLNPNVPTKKINYSYSKYRGEPFIIDWEKSRRFFIQQIIKTKDDYHFMQENMAPTERLFDDWIQRIERVNEIDWTALNLLIKRFEVTKKIYTSYDENFTPLDKRAYQNLNCYLLFGKFLTLCYSSSKKLQLLNALLKLNDILCSISDKMSGNQKSYLKENIEMEILFVKNLYQYSK